MLPAFEAAVAIVRQQVISLVKISIVIPVHNEGTSIGGFLREIIEQMQGLKFEIIVVDDGSTDNTGTAVAECTDSRIIIHHHNRRRGSGAARRTGINASTGDVIVWVDGDGTYSQADIVRVIDLVGPCDQVIGARQTDYGAWLPLRRMIKWAINRSVSWLWRTQIPDVNSGLRAFKRTSIMRILDQLPDGFSCATTATLAALNHGHNVIFTPIAYQPRGHNSKSKFHPVFDTLRLLSVVITQYVRGKKDVSPTEALRQNRK